MMGYSVQKETDLEQRRHRFLQFFIHPKLLRKANATPKSKEIEGGIYRGPLTSIVYKILIRSHTKICIGG